MGKQGAMCGLVSRETRKMIRSRVCDAETLERILKRVAEWRAAPTLKRIANEEGVSVHIVRNIASGYEYKRHRKRVESLEELKAC